MSPTNPNFSGDADDPVRVEHRYDSDTPASIAIVRAIAVLENVDPMDSPTDLGITLYDHVDPTALDRLVSEGDRTGAVTVDLTIHNDHRYAVRVRETRLTVERTVRDQTRDP